MIKLELTGKCKDCAEAELELLDLETFGGGADWRVRCIHEGACERIEQMMEEEVSE